MKLAKLTVNQEFAIQIQTYNRINTPDCVFLLLY